MVGSQGSVAAAAAAAVAAAEAAAAAAAAAVKSSHDIVANTKEPGTALDSPNVAVNEGSRVIMRCSTALCVKATVGVSV